MLSLSTEFHRNDCKEALARALGRGGLVRCAELENPTTLNRLELPLSSKVTRMDALRRHLLDDNDDASLFIVVRL